MSSNEPKLSRAAFERFTRRLLSVPKREVDALAAQKKRERDEKRKKE